jgi:hypothetical protein
MAQVILWEDSGFKGDNEDFSSDDGFLGNNFHWDGPNRLDNWNDEASSIEIFGGTVRFWTDAFNEGTPVTLGPGSYDMNQIGLPNDSISSIDFFPFG